MTGIVRAITVGVVLACSLEPPASAAADPEALRKECDFGVTLALEGRGAAAESVFISLLTHAPGDPRALTNLGNLNLLRGELAVALAFYSRAAEVDTADAGILLNQATALMLEGNEDLAQARAREAVALAGGLQSAAHLLGLPSAVLPDAGPKGAERTAVSREEVLSLLKAAAGGIPADSTRAGASSSSSAGTAQPRKRAPTWRPGGARASEGTDASTVLYWKR